MSKVTARLLSLIPFMVIAPIPGLIISLIFRIDFQWPPTLRNMIFQFFIPGVAYGLSFFVSDDADRPRSIAFKRCVVVGLVIVGTRVLQSNPLEHISKHPENAPVILSIVAAGSIFMGLIGCIQTLAALSVSRFLGNVRGREVWE